MLIHLDTAICSGHGRCYDVAPDLLEPDDDGRGIVRRAEVPAHLEDAARLAAASCPEGAIAIDPVTKVDTAIKAPGGSDDRSD